MATTINLTPHTVTVRTEADDRTFPASGQVARVTVDMTPAGEVDGIPCSTRKCGWVTGLPDVGADDEYFIVSTMVFDAVCAQVASLREVDGFNESDTDYRAGKYLQDHLLVPDSGPDAIRTAGPSATVKEALAALTENAEWAADGMPCAADMRRHVDVLTAALAAMPGQIQAVRRFIVA